MKILELYNSLPADANFEDLEKELTYLAVSDTTTYTLIMSAAATILAMTGDDVRENFEKLCKKKRSELNKAMREMIIQNHDATH